MMTHGRLEWRIWRMLGSVQGFHAVEIHERVAHHILSTVERHTAFSVQDMAYYPIADLVMQESTEP